MKKILIVEDDEFQSKIFKKFVSDAITKMKKTDKVEVDTLYEGQQAIDYIKYHKNKLKLLLLDLSLPVISGIDVLQELLKLNLDTLYLYRYPKHLLVSQK